MARRHYTPTDGEQTLRLHHFYQCLCAGLLLLAQPWLVAAQQAVLDQADYAHYVEESNSMEDEPYFGEYLDESTVNGLITDPKAERSRRYSRSTFNEFVIGGLVGIVPRVDETVEAN